MLRKPHGNQRHLIVYLLQTNILTAYHQLQILRKLALGSVNDLIYPTKEIASFIIDLLQEEDLQKSLYETSYIPREFMVSCVLHSMSNIYFSHYDGISKKTKKSTRQPRIQIGVFTHEKDRTIIGYFTSPDFIAKIASVKWTLETKHAICVIIALSAFVEDGPFYRFRAHRNNRGQKLRNYIVETWNNIFSLATGSKGTELIKAFFSIYSSTPLDSIELNLELNPGENMINPLDDRMLINHFNEVFAYHRPLSQISDEIQP